MADSPQHRPPPAPPPRLGCRSPAWARALYLLIAWLPVVWLLISGGGPSSPRGSSPPFHASRWADRARETLIVAGSTAVATFLLGGLIALATGRLRIPARRFWFVCALLPLFIPPYVSTIAAVHMLGAQGWITRWMVPGSESLPLGPTAPPTGRSAPVSLAGRVAGSGTPLAALPLAGSPPLRGAPIYTRPGVIAVLVFSFLPLVILGGWALLGLGDPATEEWALLHASPGRVLWRVILPRALPGLLVGSGVAFLLAMSEFGVPEALRTYPVLSVEVYTQMGVYYAPRAGAVAGLALVTLALVGVGILGLAIRALRSERIADIEGLDLPGLSERTLLPQGRRQRVLWTCSLLVLVFVPVASVLGTLLHSSIETEGWTSWVTAWTTGRDEIVTSVTLGLGAAGLCVLMARWMAGSVRGFHVRPRDSGPALPARARGRLLFSLACFLPLVLPGPVVATGWSQLLSAAAGWGIRDASIPARLAGDFARVLLDGPWALLLAWVGRWTPLAFGLFTLGLRQTPREWVEAARLEGAGPLQRLWILEWPVLRRPALASAALIFCLSLGEVGAAILLLPPGTTSLGVRLMTLMHYAPTATVSALALVSVVLGLGAAAVVFLVWRAGKAAIFS